jgi:hypothetical protein
METSRRKVLVTGLCAAATARLPHISTQAAETRSLSGCLITHAQFEAVRNETEFKTSKAGLFNKSKHIRTTGDAALDRALDAAIKHVSDLFREVPAFGFYQEHDHPEFTAMNAFATSEGTDIPGTWGTIGFGMDLFTSELSNYDKAGSTIIAIIAHEFGHIWAMHRGVMEQLTSGQPTNKRSELHADFLAGYFIGTRKRVSPSLTLAAVSNLFERIGDNQVNSHYHHGTPKERLAAAEEGFRTAYQNNKDANFAFSAATEYVSQK